VNTPSKIDLKIGYHQIKMKKGYGRKNDFKIKYGLFKWFVMLCSLTIVHSNLMTLMNHI
jgi:hypothetical protein